MQRFKDVSASFGMEGVEFVNVGELCWSTTLCGMDGVEFVNVGELCWSTTLYGGPYKLIKAGPCFLQRKV
ncbi:hypothetical protein QL285_075468 [Trifolium repens]|nr:hypothetical protein QL285_075468 [Trifolium repens]